jgi:hypothetical protein
MIFKSMTFVVISHYPFRALEFIYYSSNQQMHNISLKLQQCLKHQLLHVLGPIVPSSGTIQLYKTKCSAFLLHAGNENVKPT